MSNTGQFSLTSSMQNASARLEEALMRLESAVARKLDGDADRATAVAGATALAAEVESLRAERDRMAEALAALETRHAKLRETSDTVSDRLDGTIERIQEIVDE